jgi:hypothetical protein
MYSESLQYDAAQLYLSAFKMLPTQSPIYCLYSNSISMTEGVELQHGHQPTWDPCLHVLVIPRASGNLQAVVPAASLTLNYVAALSWDGKSVTIWVWDMIEGSLKWSKKIEGEQNTNLACLYSSQDHFILVIDNKVTFFDFINGIASQKPDCIDVVKIVPGSELYLRTSEGCVTLYSHDKQNAIVSTPLKAMPRTQNLYTTDPTQHSSIEAHVENISIWTRNIAWSDCGRYFVSCMEKPEPRR